MTRRPVRPTPAHARGAVRGLLAVIVVLAVAAVTVVVRQPWAEGTSAGAGAGGVGNPNYYASAKAVCGLLGPDDLELALGYDYGAGVEPELGDPAFALIPGITKCLFRPATVVDAGPFNVGVVYAYADQIFEERHAFAAGQGPVRDLEGIGRRAMWSDVLRELLVLTGDKIVGIIVPVAAAEPESIQIERARRLAETVIGRLR